MPWQTEHGPLCITATDTPGATPCVMNSRAGGVDLRDRVLGEDGRRNGLTRGACQGDSQGKRDQQHRDNIKMHRSAQEY